MKRIFILTIVSVFAMFVFAACGDDDTPNDNDSETTVVDNKIEIFSWWTAAGEIEALQALLDAFRAEYPDVEVVNLSTVEGHGQDAREALDERMAQNNPPDTFQLGPRDFQRWVEYGEETPENRLVPLDDLYTEMKWDSKYPAGVLEALKYDGSYYAVPVNMHRQNTMFYNMDLIDTPPMTLEEFFEVAETLQADGIVPLALSASAGWTVEILFYAVIAGSGGIQFHSDFFSGNADLSDETQLATLTKVVEDFAKVLSYTNSNAPDLGWDEAAELVHSGEAAMYVHGDWAKGYYLSKGWTPGTDFGAVAALGSEGSFIYNVDAFALCKNAPNEENALNFLRVLGSPTAQEAFNKKKGSTPAHPDVDISDWDSVAESTFNDFQDADIVFNVEIHQFTAEDAGLADILFEMYNGDRTEQEVIDWIVEVYEEAASKK